MSAVVLDYGLISQRLCNCLVWQDGRPICCGRQDTMAVVEDLERGTEQDKTMAKRLRDSLFWEDGLPACVGGERDEIVDILKDMGHQHNLKCENYEDEDGLMMDEKEDSSGLDAPKSAHVTSAAESSD